MSRAKSKRSKDLERKQNHDLLNQQKMIVKKYIFETSFKDKIIQEIVETETASDADKYLKTLLTPEQPQIYFAENAGWQDGLVLANQLQYEFITNAPSNSHVSDLEQLTPLERYKATPIKQIQTQENKLLILIQTS